MTPREPWHFGEAATKIVGDFVRLRYRLLPYLYSQAVSGVERGLPLMRSLILGYQDDPNSYLADLEYLLGDFLLVAPVFDETGRREVYLPSGEWIDFFSGELHSGGRWIGTCSPIERLPIFVKAGAVIPMCSRDDCILDTDPSPVIEIYAGCKGEAFIVDGAGRATVRHEELRGNDSRYAECSITVEGRVRDYRIRFRGAEDVSDLVFCGTGLFRNEGKDTTSSFWLFHIASGGVFSVRFRYLKAIE
jgi:alpha-glucosidase (family GH31 glycosyl hydrolase)